MYCITTTLALSLTYPQFVQNTIWVDTMNYRIPVTEKSISIRQNLLKNLLKCKNIGFSKFQKLKNKNHIKTF